MYWLAAAIVIEIVASMSLRISDGFTRPLPTAISIAGYAASIWMLSRALASGLPLGVAYSIWAATGIALIAIISVFAFNERLTALQIGGIALVIVGVVAIETGTH